MPLAGGITAEMRTDPAKLRNTLRSGAGEKLEESMLLCSVVVCPLLQVLCESGARKALAREGQAPHSAIVGCADSRAALDRVWDFGVVSRERPQTPDDAVIRAKGRSC